MGGTTRDNLPIKRYDFSKFTKICPKQTEIREFGTKFRYKPKFGISKPKFGPFSQ